MTANIEQHRYNGYDLALHVLNDSNMAEFHQLANDFLTEYNQLSEIVGDNDNPFNPYVNRIIELEETFLSTFFN